MATDVPRHVAIIMDGNGRWAARRHLPRQQGHRAGAERLRDIVRACPKLGIKFLTVFAFSTENWRRRPEEIDGLMALMRLYPHSLADELKRNGVRVQFIGELQRLDRSVTNRLDELAALTASCDQLCLTVAVNYGGRAEMAAAARQVAERVASGELLARDITEDTLSAHLLTKDLPDPDLVIRTSGEFRLSNFLLWQAAYAEFEFVDTLWPDFTPGDLASIVRRYPGRIRRFGAAAG
ncbi:MAG: polyprenyl diphosphate synthase [Rhodobacteraceae bacterium]|nr:polyprenyl diphosphate synthase [Paracoccaceae bacterium]